MNADGKLYSCHMCEVPALAFYSHYPYYLYVHVTIHAFDSQSDPSIPFSLYSLHLFLILPCAIPFSY